MPNRIGSGWELAKQALLQLDPHQGVDGRRGDPLHLVCENLDYLDLLLYIITVTSPYVDGQI